MFGEREPIHSNFQLPPWLPLLEHEYRPRHLLNSVPSLSNYLEQLLRTNHYILIIQLLMVHI